MKIEQIYTGCLAQGAYYITSNGEAAIIDPLRETKPYLDRLAKDGVKLKYIFETHFHADFVSGHLDLSNATGAPIIYGPTANPTFSATIAEDGKVFKLGDVTITVIHTPGHTMESTTYLLKDENGNEHAVFTGDTLFIGDVGRPDLAQKATGLTQEQLASHLFHSLRNKLMVLSDEVIVYPGHGAGSACGKNMSKETVSTIGQQKQSNYALRADMTEEEFIKEVTAGLTAPPGYFGMNVAMNKEGYGSIDQVLSQGMKPLNVSELKAMVEETGAVVLDTRDSESFSKGFIPQAINIGIEGGFAPWVGAMLVEVNTPIVLVADPGKEQDVVTRLARVGFDNVLGFLQGGMESWIRSGEEVDQIDRISAEDLEQILSKGSVDVLDVRAASEYAAEHVEDAYNRPLQKINEWWNQLDDRKTYYLHCAGGYRSMIAASILQARGVRNFREIRGGFSSIAKTKINKTNFICQSKVY